MDVKLATDTDGFVSQECPGCENRFKVVLGAGSDKSISFCPYCGHEGRDCWWTPEQAEYLSSIVADELIGPELERMARSFNQRGRGSSFVRMTMSVDRPQRRAMPEEPDEEMPTTTFVCCNERVKHQATDNKHLYCIICGQSVDAA
ncbi:hypothetical protein WME88_52000 [Sorangium sp. So ce216]